MSKKLTVVIEGDMYDTTRLIMELQKMTKQDNPIVQEIRHKFTPKGTYSEEASVLSIKLVEEV